MIEECEVVVGPKWKVAYLQRVAKDVALPTLMDMIVGITGDPQQKEKESFSSESSRPRLLQFETLACLLWTLPASC